jgi:hypothetical protein
MDIELIGQAQQFDEKINSIKTQFFSALDDFKKYYVYYNKNPEVNEFQNYYRDLAKRVKNKEIDLQKILIGEAIFFDKEKVYAYSGKMNEYTMFSNSG